jgi:hypothetical protein
MAAMRGMHKVEFFTHLDEIKSMYENGYVVLKILYEELKEKYNWSMSYWSFCKYMKEEVLASDSNITPKSRGEVQAKNEAENYMKNLEKKESISTGSTGKIAVDSKAAEPDSEKERKRRIFQEILERNNAFIGDKWK